MNNPFKLSSVIEDPLFTNGREEFARIKEILNSANHLILVGPRRFGKSSLIKKVLTSCKRPWLLINLEHIDSLEELALLIMKETLKQQPFDRIKHLLKGFHAVPTISINPVTDDLDLSFPAALNPNHLLEDALRLLESVGSKKQRMIVVFDEFQEITQLERDIDQKMRALMQSHQHVTYVFIGSQESAMTALFEKVRSPLYHFGQWMYLKKIPYDILLGYLEQGLKNVAKTKAKDLASRILRTCDSHTYYTQQLASTVWDLLAYKKIKESADPVEQAIEQITTIHDLDYERLWLNFSKTNRRVLKELASGSVLSHNKAYATSTSYSAVGRLMKDGYVIKTDKHEIEDPFFKHWINTRQISSSANG